MNIDNIIKNLNKYLYEYKEYANEEINKHPETFKYYEFCQKFFTYERISKAKWIDFQEIGNNLNCYVNMPLAQKRAFGKPNHDIEHYISVFQFLLNDDIPLEERVRLFINDKKYKINYITNGKYEIVGYKFPEKYIIKNSTSDVALKVLGNLENLNFIDFNNLLNHEIKIQELYNNIVGKQTEYPINIEIDRFLYWLATETDAGKNLYNKRKIWIFAAGEGAKLWEDFYNDGIMALGWDDVGDLRRYKSQKELKAKIQKLNHNSDSDFRNRVKALWDICNTVSENDIIYVKKGNRSIVGRGIVSSIYQYDETRKGYEHYREINWTSTSEYENVRDEDFAHKALTEITNDLELCKKLENLYKNGDNMDKQPLNQILYGPPGTGKTYNTKNIISKIFKMKENFYNWFIDKSNANDKEKTFKDYLSSIIKINENFGINIFEIYDKKRFVNIKNLIKETDYYKNNYKHSETSQGTSYYDSALNQYENFLNDTNYVKRVEFITFHQSYSYEEFVEGIRPVILRGDDWGKETDVKYKGEDGIFKQICNRAREYKENNYVLIIDEINRGNISKIFGELITLIEDDKRECVNGIEPEKYNTIKVRLPYSQNEFSVPNNLYIIGTMNTSDRSIASVDIALRRRFKFVEMMPDESKVANFGVQFESIFEKLNKKIEILLDRDHKIGHSYFIKDKYDKADSETLCEIWYDSIIPLLNEYFYNDWEKLELLIPGFIDKKDIDELKEYCSQDYYYSFIPKDDFYVEEVFDKTKFENALKQDVSEGK